MRGNHRRVLRLISTLICGASVVYGQSQTALPSPDYDALLHEAIAVGPDLEFGPLLDELARRHASTTGTDEPSARIKVLQQLAELEMKRGNALQAQARLGNAIAIAEALRDPLHLFELYFRQAEILLAAHDRFRATEQALKGWDLAKLTNNSAQQIQAGLFLGELYFQQGTWEQWEPEYETLLKLPDADHLAIEKHRAHRTPTKRIDESIQRWNRVLDLARDQKNSADQAVALDRLAYIQIDRENWTTGLDYFRAADALKPPTSRPPYLIRRYIKALRMTGQQTAAAQLLQDVLANLAADIPSDTAANFHIQRAEILAEMEDFPQAYRELKLADELRQSPTGMGFVQSAASAVPATSVRDVDNASLLAAARTALREAELESTRQRHNYAIALGSFAILLAAALAVAYYFKRRAAAAMATARDAAELRAERTHWQMLRYQLNPHFLFNALTSLSGLALIDAQATRQAIGRLSQFCRLSLERTTGDFRTVEEEFLLLGAFLDVEKIGMGDRLHCHIDLNTSAKSRLLPPLLLQPLLENALKYGARTSGELLEITLSARVDPDTNDLVIVVANTGAWVEVDATKRRREHIGLANVRERLALLNPSPQAFSTTTNGGWVKITVRLPELINS